MNKLQSIRCYAVRRLNPFLGVMQVLETPRGRASTANGVVWQLELLATRPTGWGSLNMGGEEQGWYLHGLWSESEGLVKFPQAQLHAGRAEVTSCEDLIETVRTTAATLPFPLRDHRELWLLEEAERKPLALLFSTLMDASLPQPEPRCWCGSWGRDDLAGQRRFSQIRRLETEVKKRAGFNCSTLWVTWNPARTRAHTAEGSLIDRDEFPVYGIREEWPNENNEALVEGYINWIAPSLLTLPYLRDEERSRLESRLRYQASSIEYHWRLYPKILDEEKIIAARVQARLQSANENGKTDYPGESHE